jgi:hypothetical protein
MISIVCVYNNQKILEKYLLKGLQKQTAKYDLILIDNTEMQFNSAAEALNKGGRQTNPRSKYIMFVHQDIDLSSESWLENAENALYPLPNLGIAGVAGKKDKNGIITNIKNGDPPVFPAGAIQITTSTKVQTLDECLVIIPKNVFEFIQFDEVICNNWHLYAVDYCLSIKCLGFAAYVLPIPVYHRSPGDSFSELYFVTLENVLRKHTNRYEMIFTTIGNWSTRSPLKMQIPYIKKCLFRNVKYARRLMKIL